MSSPSKTGVFLWLKLVVVDPERGPVSVSICRMFAKCRTPAKCLEYTLFSGKISIETRISSSVNR